MVENQEKSGKKNNNKLLVAGIIILIIIILILLFLNYLLLKNNKTMKERVPTGNVDIFEINCDYNCACNTNNNTVDINGNSKWESTNVLNLFSNPFFEGENIIAPLSTNAYEFIIKNSTNFNVSYNLKFVEDNEYNINMKYRLKRNNEYIAGNDEEWITYEELNTSVDNLDTKGSDTYYLEWKWFESENDTEVGSQIEANYILNIELSAKQL